LGTTSMCMATCYAMHKPNVKLFTWLHYSNGTLNTVLSLSR